MSAPPGRLTRSQQLIWTGQQLSPGLPLYNMAWRFELPLAIDADYFEAAFQALVDGSDALRSVFESGDGKPVCRVLKHLDSGLEHVDLSAAADPDAAMSDWIATRAARPFDLSVSAFDSALLRLDDSRWCWFFNQHHIATDASSVALIYRRMAELYALARDGRLDQAGALPTFTDYVDYEQSLQQTPLHAAARQHWQAKADEASSHSGGLHLYGRAPARNAGRPSAQTRRLQLPFGPQRSARLRALAEQDGVRTLSLPLTQFQLLATAFFAWLARVGASRDLTIGAPAHIRQSLAFRETIGLFIEMFPLRLTLAPGETFRSLLAKVALETQDFLRHAQPGASSAASVRPFNVVLNYIPVTFARFEGVAAPLEWVHAGYGDPGHDLRLQLHDFRDQGEILAQFDVNIETFPDALQAVLPGHFLRVLDALLDDLDGAIDALPLLSAAEHEQLVQRYNRPASATTDSTGVLARFAAQVAEHPQRTALRLGTQRLSYAELDRRSSALANRLLARGLGNGDLIGVHMARSLELLIAILGVLKAGAGYVPLEAGLPVQRLALILRNTAMPLVLTQSALQPALGDAAGDVLCLDAGWSPPSSAGETEALPLPDAEQTAYVIFTSGSSGEPKGVVVQHQALAQYADWAWRTFAGGQPAVFALYSSIGFDLTVTSLFAPLISGGSITIYAEQSAASQTGSGFAGADLAVLEVFERDQVDVVKLTPAHLALVLELGRPLQRISRLIVGGEDLSSALASRATRILTAGNGKVLALFNEYGPTEAVVGCMVHRYQPQQDRAASVPIGVPGDGVRIYLLDEGQNPVPQGVSGELYIGGSRLAAGYLVRPGGGDLTAERFVADPLVAGGRMYRSGDLARFIAPGSVEYLGRADAQIKIRGVRIEPAEIETALLAHPLIDACVVTVSRADKPVVEAEVQHCSRCGLGTDYPGTRLDGDGVCNLCRGLDEYRDRAGMYFHSLDALRERLAGLAGKFANGKAGDYDCLMLLSGGKDSSYAIYRLAELGPRILAITLDNGFISDGAKANIRRVVGSLGIDHRFVATPAMNAIFVDSLQRHANVCQGCFKALYTLAVQTAVAERIPAIVTGLSRGQFFETRLTPELLADPATDAEVIDRVVLAARKNYHQVDDAVRQLMDTRLFDDGRVLEQIEFIDFYRYCDVSLDELYRFLDEHAPWIRPLDTGRSTNCLINDAGIVVHKRSRGFHNYALPYSWDVRLGHKTRDAALEELDDHIDVRRVHQILDQIGYQQGELDASPGAARLVAYFTVRGEPGADISKAAINRAELREFLAQRLPAVMIPAHLVPLQRLPLTANGKLDSAALPDPRSASLAAEQTHLPPQSPLERRIAALWCKVLRVERVGITDNFFDLGGDSIAAIQIAARANAEGLLLSITQLFQYQTVAELAALTGIAAEQAERQSDAYAPITGSFPLTPIQRWFFDHQMTQPEHWNHVVELQLAEALSLEGLQRALSALILRHASLRTAFTRQGDDWLQQIVEQPPPFQLLAASASVESATESVATVEAALHRSIDLASGRLLAAALLPVTGGRRSLLMVVHHLAVDALSWTVLLDDLNTLVRGGQLQQPGAPFHAWAAALQRDAAQPLAPAEAAYWRQQTRVPAPLAVAAAPDGGSARVITRRLATADIAGLELRSESGAASFAGAQAVLLTALALTLAEQSALNPLRLELESHGREGLRGGHGNGLDSSQTVGWFTAIYPLTLPQASSADVAGLLAAVRALLDQLPRGGVGYGQQRYLAMDRQQAASPSACAGIQFNYLGRLGTPGAQLRHDAWLRPVAPLRLSRASSTRRRRVWEINAWIDDDGLNIDWDYSDQIDSDARMQSLADTLLDHLCVLLRSEQEQPQPSPQRKAADFSLAGLDDKKLAALAGLLAGGSEHG